MTTTLRKFTKVNGTEIIISFKDLISRREFHYSKNYQVKPTVQDRQEYLYEVLEACGFVSTMGLKPIN